MQVLHIQFTFHVHSCIADGDDPHNLESKLAEAGKLGSSTKVDRKSRMLCIVFKGRTDVVYAEIIDVVEE